MQHKFTTDLSMETNYEMHHCRLQTIIPDQLFAIALPGTARRALGKFGKLGIAAPQSATSKKRGDLSARLAADLAVEFCRVAAFCTYADRMEGARIPQPLHWVDTYFSPFPRPAARSWDGSASIQHCPCWSSRRRAVKLEGRSAGSLLFLWPRAWV